MNHSLFQSEQFRGLECIYSVTCPPPGRPHTQWLSLPTLSLPQPPAAPDLHSVPGSAMGITAYVVFRVTEITSSSSTPTVAQASASLLCGAQCSSIVWTSAVFRSRDFHVHFANPKAGHQKGFFCHLSSRGLDMRYSEVAWSGGRKEGPGLAHPFSLSALPLQILSLLNT